MVVGFFLDYQRSDDCYAALQLAHVAEAEGLEVSVFPLDAIGEVHPSLDRRVCRSARGFPAWCRGCSHVVFTQVPPPELVEAAHAGGAEVTLLWQWTSMDREALAHLEGPDRVVCPSRVSYRHLRSAGEARNVDPARVTCLPWGTPAPPVQPRRVVDEDRVAVLWYLDGSQPLLQDAGTLAVADALVRHHANAFLTILYNPAHVVAAVVDEFKALQQRAAGRLELVRGISWERQVVLASQHDLVLWPALAESFGLPGILAATAGTPCLAYDHPAVAELVRDGLGGVLVPCDLRFDWFDVPIVVPDHDAYYHAAADLIGDAPRLQALRATTQERLSKRREAFLVGAAALFKDGTRR